jgi:hypothetical protein
MRIGVPVSGSAESMTPSVPVLSVSWTDHRGGVVRRCR